MQKAVCYAKDWAKVDELRDKLKKLDVDMRDQKA